MQRHGQVRAQGRALPCPNILPEMPQTPLSCKQPVCIDSKRSGYTGKALGKHPVSSNSICAFGTRQTGALKEQHYWRGSSNGQLWVMKSCFFFWVAQLLDFPNKSFLRLWKSQGASNTSRKRREGGCISSQAPAEQRSQCLEDHTSQSPYLFLSPYPHSGRYSGTAGGLENHLSFPKESKVSAAVHSSSGSTSDPAQHGRAAPDPGMLLELGAPGTTDTGCKLALGDLSSAFLQPNTHSSHRRNCRPISSWLCSLQ